MNPSGERPLVSVITASFNALEGLRRTVESVASQDFASCEHVIVDGGSTDGSREFLEGLGGEIRWISEPDDGIADALNKGVGMARGEWILVLQAEDSFLDRGSLTCAVAALDGSVDIVSFHVITTSDSKVRRFRSKGLGLRAEFFMTVPHQGALCRASLFDRVGGFDRKLRVAMDYDFMLRSKRAHVRIKVVNQVLAVMPANGISARRDWPSLKARIEENRMIQGRYPSGPVAFQVHRLFWFIYPAFKRFRSWLAIG